jgi:DNA polymerase elongation subunit (family B)
VIAGWTEHGRIRASYRKDGVLSIRDLGEAQYAAYVRDPSALRDDIGVIKRMEDFPGWTKLLFVDYDSRKRALENNPSLLYEADVNPVRRFISDNSRVIVEPPKRVYLDIETDSRVRFSSAIEGEARLLSFALVSADRKARHTAVLEDDDDQAEAELWAHLWKLMADYDQVAAWNGDGFDFLVKDARCAILAKQYKPLSDLFWEHKRRLLFVDQLACFRRHHMAAESGDDKTSFKLDSVCEALIHEGKNDFPSSKTWDYWAAGGAKRQELVAYNLQDTELLPKLEDETGYLELQQTIAEVTLTFANSHGLKPMPQVDGYMLRMAHERKTHLPSKKPPTGLEKKYEGAFVFKPESLGVHRMVHVCDFKSLYPTVIRTFNISPETKGGAIEPSIAFRTEVPFDNSIEGMLPAACRAAMDLREYWKQVYKREPNNKGAERKSKAYKIFNNSMYGVVGSVWSRYYDVQIAESITLGAKHLNDETAKAARARGWQVVYMDTDSLFVMGCTVEEFKEFVGWCNAVLYPSLLNAQGCPADQQCIALDYEKCFNRLIFPLGNKGTPAAKRYIGSYLHFAFKPKDKPEIRGLEYMRGDSVRYARHMQKEAIDLLLKGEVTAEQMHEWVKRKRELFFDAKLDVDDIAKSAGISQALDDYETNAPHVRVAREMQERGEDVSEGTRIAYVIVDGRVSPAKVIAAEEFDGTHCDRHFYWNKAIYPATMRVLAGAFPESNWKRWVAKYPKRILPGQLALV